MCRLKHMMSGSFKHTPAVVQGQVSLSLEASASVSEPSEVDVSDSTSAVGGGGEVVDGNVTGTIFTMRALDTAVEGCVPVQVGVVERNILTVYTIM